MPILLRKERGELELNSLKIEQKEMEELERIQGCVLKAILNLPVTTPYLGILKETGIWPIKNVIEYYRLMLFQIYIIQY